MFGIGPTEFVIIAIVALMLFSPKELPKILRSAAKFWGSLRNTADEFRDAIMNEEELQDIRGMLKGGAAEIKRAESAARQELMRARMEMQKAQNKLLKTVKAAEDAKRAELAAAAGEGEATPASPANASAPAESGDAAIAPSGAVAAARPGRPEPAAEAPAAAEATAAEPTPAAAASGSTGLDQGAA